ncbi:MAG: uracil-DNA glycosylase family protein [Thermoguttaceae bacterium]
MDKLSKTSLNYYLSEYLEDLKRAGVQEVWRGAARQDAPAPNREAAAPPARRRPVSPSPTASQAPKASVLRVASANILPAVERPAANPDCASRGEQLKALAEKVAQCALCDELVASRTQTVFGSGNPCAELAFVGEGPGAEEDLRGEPFVGRSGKLLTDMIEKGMGIPRSSVYICNIVRCRPPANRNPTESEARACRPFLEATLDVVQPRFICCLGSIAANNLLGVTMPIGRLRGEVHEYRGAQVVCTYHPAYLLRNPAAKKDAWQDLQLLMRIMGLELPKR